MEFIIGGAGILMLLFLAYCAIAIPYYYIKKFYLKAKGVKKSAVNLSVKLQKDNTRRTLERLLNAMRDGEEYMKESGGKMLLKDQEESHKNSKAVIMGYGWTRYKGRIKARTV